MFCITYNYVSDTYSVLALSMLYIYNKNKHIKDKSKISSKTHKEIKIRKETKTRTKSVLTFFLYHNIIETRRQEGTKKSSFQISGKISLI